MGILLTSPITVPFVFLVVLVLVLLFRKPNTTTTTQPRSKRITYVTDNEGWLKAVEEDDVADVVAGYASRGGRDK